MRVKFIGCEILKKEFLALGIEDTADCEFWEFALHKDVDKLHKTLQEAIDANQDYDRISLGYCRCSAALLGLKTAKAQLLFPTTHDCVGLLLGSTPRHLSLINEEPGTLYLSQGFLDYGVNLYEESLGYFEKYGEKKARKVIKALYGGYKRALFIDSPGIESAEKYAEYQRKSQELVDFFQWRLDYTQGDASLLEALVRGEPREELILLEPGGEITKDCFAEFPMVYNEI